jgi:hypothetical protein
VKSANGFHTEFKIYGIAKEKAAKEAAVTIAVCFLCLIYFEKKSRMLSILISVHEAIM